jgi:hypothetical protein
MRELIHFPVNQLAHATRELCAKDSWDESWYSSVTVLAPLPAKGNPAPLQEDTTPVKRLNKGLERIDAVTKSGARHAGI